MFTLTFRLSTILCHVASTMLNAISTRLRATPSSQPPSTASSGVSAGSPSSSGQSSPEPPIPIAPATSASSASASSASAGGGGSSRHKQHLIRRVLRAPLGGSSAGAKAKAQSRSDRERERDNQKHASNSIMHNSSSIKDLVSTERTKKCCYVFSSQWHYPVYW